jgi:hypothetical protein
MNFEKVITGIIRYIERNIYPNLNDWQEVIIGTAVDTLYESRADLYNLIQKNYAYKMLLGMDRDGNIDIDSLAKKLKNKIEKKGKVDVALPMKIKLTFTSSDIDDILAVIKE